MTTTAIPRSIVLALALAGASTALACANAAPGSPAGIELSAAGDTVTGSGSLDELRRRRAAWVARGIDDYRVDMQITCFCGGDIRRPAVVEVRDGAVVSVLDRETGKPLESAEHFPTIMMLFDDALAMAAGGSTVSVAWDRALGFPARIEIGTLANDAGSLYHLSNLRRL